VSAHKAAEEQTKNLQTKVDDLARQLETAMHRVHAAERQVTGMTTQRDTARQDAEHVGDVLVTERREAKEAAEQIRQQAALEIASVQATCQAQADTARELASSAVARAERAEAALDAERTERRALTERLTAVTAQLARSRIRTTPPRKQPRLP
jgi:chromosome segregation ATPase